MSKITAIVVTYNRAELLIESLNALLDQTRKLDAIIIVDNQSTDNTTELLKVNNFISHIPESKPLNPKIQINFKKNSEIHYIRNNWNGGSSGGQYDGIKYAYQNGFDWFWCMDDDTIVDANALESIITKKVFKDDATGALGCVVKWIDGSLHNMNMHGNPLELSWLLDYNDEKTVPVKTLSFVALMVSKRAVKEVGLPIKDFFIWYDDVEFTDRIASRFKNYYIFDSIAVHKTKENVGADISQINQENYFKFFYGWRNLIVFLKYENINKFKRILKIINILISRLIFVLKHKLPIKLYFSLLKGLFRSKKVEYVE